MQHSLVVYRIENKKMILRDGMNIGINTLFLVLNNQDLDCIYLHHNGNIWEKNDKETSLNQKLPH